MKQQKSITFKNPNGWYHSGNSMLSSPSDGQARDLSDSSDNARFFKTYNRYWKRFDEEP